MPKDLPSYKMMFCYRTGLKLEPSQNFVDKFIEIYNGLLEKRTWKETPKKIDENTAKFMINSVFEAIIYCMDMDFDVWVNRAMVFTQKIIDKRQYSHTAKKYTIKENLKQICLRPIQSYIRKIKIKMNLNNEPYKEFTRKKSEHFNEIKQYYKDFYGQEVWWQQSN